ncbi:MAG: hypothetical protein CMB52_02375 [Euryarchaeota archaeon]|nr:hypothetical protein [Euryarchaeota archaeon]
MSQGSEVDILVVEQATNAIQQAGLPPSKSHLIRWLLMASQSEQAVTISGVSGAADDVLSMRDALIELGVDMDFNENSWTVHGVGANGFSTPANGLNLHNSGTAFRLLTFACLRMGEVVTVDGDSTLEPRIDRDFWSSLDVEVEFGSERQNLPLKIKGPFRKENLLIDGSKTSQHLSAILLSMPAMNSPLDLTIEGDIVSQRHALLSFQIAAECGSENEFGGHRLLPWKCQPPSQVEIPRDASHISFWKLYEILHDTTLDIPEVQVKDSIGAELLTELDIKVHQTVDLSLANDLITPLAAAMALGGGGRIFGAGHARFKESNRIEQTASMLAAFSIEVNCTPDGLEIEGGQTPESPNAVVQAYGDHRMQMTAAILATKVGAKIEGSELHRVSFPEFLNYLHP